MEKLRGKCRRGGKARDIHELRVILRRLRLFASMGSPCLGKRSVRDFRAWSREVSDALGPLRDLDVTLEWLESPSGMGETQHELGARRAGIWLRMRSRIVPMPRRLEAALRQTGDRAKDAEHLLRQFNLVKSGLVAKLRAGLPTALLQSPQKQHAFRRGLRRLRFLREADLSRDAQRKDPLLGLLVELHESLGNRQNTRVIVHCLRGRGHFPGKTKLLAKLRQQVEEAEPGLRAGLQRLAPCLEKMGD